MNTLFYSFSGILMIISVFDLFSIGIGPSSSHTVGPMKAARCFVIELKEMNQLTLASRLGIELFGSLAFTGKGHGTDRALLLGLEGHTPALVDPDLINSRAQEIGESKQLRLLDIHPLAFDPAQDIRFNTRDLLPRHPNGMRFTAYDSHHQPIYSKIYYSVGGGFILDENETQAPSPASSQPYPFNDAKTLLRHCEQHQLSIKEVMMANEMALRTKDEIQKNLLHIAKIMRACIDKGCISPGILPGGLHIKRRAPEVYQKLIQQTHPKSHEHISSLDWLNLYAIAVNEENAAGGRVVTAPTNGAAGIIPAVLMYYLNFYPQAKEEDTIDFLLTAGAMAILYKRGASLSGAEVGCQGEVGVACSMAAAGLAAVLGATIYQIENAAEIAMEHHLGLTCDPIGGLVQIPCIERNAMGTAKAVNAARLALLGNGEHHVSLDKVIATMKQTGQDMMSIYKETSQGGLAVTFTEC